MNNAETFARVTGSVAATYTVERRLPTGELVTESVETYTRPEVAAPTATPCCDGTGWTGNQYERCTEHYEPLDGIWFS